MYPLYFAKRKVSLLIKEVKIQEKNKKKYTELGFITGAKISVEREEGPNLVVRLGSSYFIIVKELSFSIFVEEDIRDE